VCLPYEDGRDAMDEEEHEDEVEDEHEADLSLRWIGAEVGGELVSWWREMR
jgi:hypothetical protein